MAHRYQTVLSHAFTIPTPPSYVLHRWFPMQQLIRMHDGTRRWHQTFATFLCDGPWIFDLEKTELRSPGNPDENPKCFVSPFGHGVEPPFRRKTDSPRKSIWHGLYTLFVSWNLDAWEHDHRDQRFITCIDRLEALIRSLDIWNPNQWALRPKEVFQRNPATTKSWGRCFFWHVSSSFGH